MLIHHTGKGGDREGSIDMDTGCIMRLRVPLGNLRGAVLRAQTESQATQGATEGAATVNGEQRQHRAAQ